MRRRDEAAESLSSRSRRPVVRSPLPPAPTGLAASLVPTSLVNRLSPTELSAFLRGAEERRERRGPRGMVVGGSRERAGALAR
mmetsp:Transcript_2931/g.8695  ORF Transcript_2931/g.8695 Transcript_2931/m.8695 type:complete len:83 (+) Transcript_2931:448-696(+)